MSPRPGSKHSQTVWGKGATCNEKAYGKAHLEVAADLDNLAAYLDELGEKVESASLSRRAAAIKAGAK